MDLTGENAPYPGQAAQHNRTVQPSQVTPAREQFQPSLGNPLVVNPALDKFESCDWGIPRRC